jgi:hypothetical protein
LQQEGITCSRNPRNPRNRLFCVKIRKKESNGPRFSRLSTQYRRKKNLDIEIIVVFVSGVENALEKKVSHVTVSGGQGRFLLQG